MPNQIILNPQSFRFSDIIGQFPADRKVKKKVFFQAELQSLENGNAKFGIIAYPAWRTGGCWEIGTKISGSEAGEGTLVNFAEPFGLANNELTLSPAKKKKKRKKKDKNNKMAKRTKAFLKHFNNIFCDKKLAEKAVFHCRTGISQNPHLEYDVTLESEGVSLRVKTNPSPPAMPVE